MKPQSAPSSVSKAQTEAAEKEELQAINILASRIEKAKDAKDGKASDPNLPTVRGDLLARN